MKHLIDSVAKSFIVGMCALLPVVVIFQRWSVAIAGLGTAIIFAAAGWLDAKWQSHWRWYCTLITLAPFLVSAGTGWVPLLVRFFTAPRHSETVTFFGWLPPVAVVSAFGGALAAIGSRRAPGHG